MLEGGRDIKSEARRPAWPVSWGRAGWWGSELGTMDMQGWERHCSKASMAPRRESHSPPSHLPPTLAGATLSSSHAPP